MLIGQRIQTVHRETNEKYHKLISRLADKTGCPLIAVRH